MVMNFINKNAMNAATLLSKKNIITLIHNNKNILNRVLVEEPNIKAYANPSEVSMDI